MKKRPVVTGLFFMGAVQRVPKTTMVFPFTCTRPCSSRLFSTRPTISPRAADDPADLLAGDLDLHAVRVGHGVRLLAQVQQGAGHASGDVEEGQVAHLAGGLAQAVGHLAAEGVEDLRVLLRQFAELRIADLGDFAFHLGANPGAAFLFAAFLFEQSQLAEEITAVEVADDHFAAVVVLDEDGDRTLDDEEQRFAAIAGIDDGALCGVAAAVTVCEQLV